MLAAEPDDLSLVLGVKGYCMWVAGSAPQHGVDAVFSAPVWFLAEWCFIRKSNGRCLTTPLHFTPQPLQLLSLSCVSICRVCLCIAVLLTEL